jgi:hypothetical protein
VKRKIGIALILGGLGYTAYRLYTGTVAIKSNLNKPTDEAFKLEWATYRTSGLYPSIGAVALGAYLVS